MANAGRMLAWASLGLLISALASACSGGTDSAASCGPLDDLGVEIVSYGELLVWPGVTFGPFQDATDDLAAAVLLVTNISDDGYATDIAEAFMPVAEAVRSTIPISLNVELRPEEPAPMAAAFVSTELQPLIDAHTRAVDEQC